MFDAFHNVASSQIPKFIEKTADIKKDLTLTDNYSELPVSKQSSNLNFEVESGGVYAKLLFN
jgi:hypothetical protein